MGAVTSVLVTLSIQTGYLMFTNQAQVWTLENATQYFFFFGDTLELSSTFGFGWQFIQRKIGIHVTLFKWKMELYVDQASASNN